MVLFGIVHKIGRLVLSRRQRDEPKAVSK